MKKDSNEALEAYKIRIDALEIINEAYLAKIEALELLNRNLQFLRDAKKQSPASGPAASAAEPAKARPTPIAKEPGEKKGRGRPRKYPVGTNYYQVTKGSKPTPTASSEKRGRGRPRKTVAPMAASSEPSSEDRTSGDGAAYGAPSTEVKRGRGRPRKDGAAPRPAVTETGEKRGRGRPRKNGPKPEASLTEAGEKRGRGRPRKYPIGSRPVSKPAAIPIFGKRRRGRRPKTNVGITRLQIPLEIALREMLHDEAYNKATYRALSGILLCLFENKTATVNSLVEYIGGSKVTVVRQTALLKKMKLITYEGSRKKGQYELTPQGHHLHERLLNA